MVRLWARHCPCCRRLLQKEDAQCDWLCLCGWRGADDVSLRAATKSNGSRLIA